MNTRQIHFTAWPDKGVPADVTCMIEHRQKVRSLHKDKASPILVHCRYMFWFTVDSQINEDQYKQ